MQHMLALKYKSSCGRLSKAGIIGKHLVSPELQLLNHRSLLPAVDAAERALLPKTAWQLF